MQVLEDVGGVEIDEYIGDYLHHIERLLRIVLIFSDCIHHYDDAEIDQQVSRRKDEFLETEPLPGGDKAGQNAEKNVACSENEQQQHGIVHRLERSDAGPEKGRHRGFDYIPVHISIVKMKKPVSAHSPQREGPAPRHSCAILPRQKYYPPHTADFYKSGNTLP